MTALLNRVRRKILSMLRLAARDDFPEQGFSPGTWEFPGLDILSSEELSRLNKLLPWNSWVVDKSGRRFGNRFSTSKRNEPEHIPDSRIVELHRRVCLTDKKVLEIGCFEGNHTVALAAFSKKVVAVDARIEHVVKTIVRCHMAGFSPEVRYWNVEMPPPSHLDIDCDVLHHVGVLYHLHEPVKHLEFICRHVRHSIMLDTHVAPEKVVLEQGEGFRYWRFGEHGRANPFAGMGDHAKWVVLDDLVNIVKKLGFESVDVAQKRMERNGPRVLIYASRESA